LFNYLLVLRIFNILAKSFNEASINWATAWDFELGDDELFDSVFAALTA